jgi:predicted phage terminase large subunit-like protein
MRTSRINSHDQTLITDAQKLRATIASYQTSNLSEFVKQAYSILEPGRPLVWSWNYDYVCELLTLMSRGQLLRLIVNVPPRTLKSTLITIIFPVWVWISDPTKRFMAASYSHDLSSQHSLKRRDLIRSRWFQDLFGDRFHLSGDCNRGDNFKNSHDGQMIATSVGGSVMGHGFDVGILDDPMSADQALSSTERNNTNGWITHTFMTRQNDPSRGAVILVSQRLHCFDPTGFLLEHQPGIWQHVKIPLVAEEDECWKFPLSQRVVLRKRGEVLQPERFTNNVIEQLSLERFTYASQYQQTPLPLEGNLIRYSDVRYYRGFDPQTNLPDEILPENFDFKVISVDCAFKDLPTSDYVALIVIGTKGRKRYILDVVNRHLNSIETEKEILRLKNGYFPCSVIIEDKANGPAVIQRLKLQVPGIIEIRPQGGKISRMCAVMGEWAAGDWYVPRNASWIAGFLEQLTAFPHAKNDDMCDAMSQAATWLTARGQNVVTQRNAFTGEEIPWKTS